MGNAPKNLPRWYLCQTLELQKDDKKANLDKLIYKIYLNVENLQLAKQN